MINIAVRQVEHKRLNDAMVDDEADGDAKVGDLEYRVRCAVERVDESKVGRWIGVRCGVFYRFFTEVFYVAKLSKRR